MQSRWQIAGIVWFVWLLFVSREAELNYLFSGGFVGNNKILQQRLRIVEELRRLEQQGITLISCGNNFELEYLLPKSRNFKKCEEILTNHFSSKVMLVNYFPDPKNMPNLFIRSDADHYFADFRLVPKAISAKCSHEYLKTENFALNWCQ